MFSSPPKKRSRLDLVDVDLELVRRIKKSNFDFSKLKTNNAKSKLNYYKRSFEGKLFLEEKLDDILKFKGDRDCGYFEVLSSYYFALGRYEEAFKAVFKALEIVGLADNFLEKYSASEWLEKLRSLNEDQKRILYSHRRIKKQTAQKPMVGFKDFQEPQTVDYKRYSDFTVREFSRDYCRTGQPAIIKDYPGPRWDEDFLISEIGSKNVELKLFDEYSDEWAGLVPGITTSVSRYLNNPKLRSSYYLFDWSLPLHCPELAFDVPRYFREDYLKKAGRLYEDSWPSLFIGASGMRSGLHVDAFGSHFWMYLMKGTKKWTFFEPKYESLLKPVCYSSMDPVFGTENVDNIPRKEVELKAGEIIFVPAGWPHKVFNATDTIAVSGNFVNGSNASDVLEHLKINSLRDERAGELLNEIIPLMSRDRN